MFQCSRLSFHCPNTQNDLLLLKYHLSLPADWDICGCRFVSAPFNCPTESFEEAELFEPQSNRLVTSIVSDHEKGLHNQLSHNQSSIRILCMTADTPKATRLRIIQDIFPAWLDGL